MRTTASAGHREAGSAIVEFLLVPVVYLVLVLVQSAAFAVDGAACEPVRAFVAADDAAATERALAAAGPRRSADSAARIASGDGRAGHGFPREQGKTRSARQ